MGALARLRQGFGAPSARRALGVLATLMLLLLFSWPAFAGGRPQARLDKTLRTRVATPGVSRVIVRSAGGDVSQKIRGFRGRTGERLALVDGYVADVPNDALEALAADPGVAGVHLDRPVGALLAPGNGGAGGRQNGSIESTLQFTGAGVGVAVIDSGLTPWHDDLARVEIAHDYAGIEAAVVWQTVEHRLPELRIAVEGILKRLP